MEWTGSPEGFALALRLSQLRSAIRVGQALAKVCPTEESWEAVMSDSEVQETLSALAEIVNDITTDMETASPDTITDTVLRHHSRGLESLEPLCELFELDPEDMLVVLTN